jgi:Uma2 family endonuclease
MNGDVYSMSPSPSSAHQRTSAFISTVFGNYFMEKECEFFHAPLDVFLGDNCLVPDALVVCGAGKIRSDGCHGAPELVIEILSPSTAFNDKFLKLNLYREFGVKEYWIVDPLKEGVISVELFCFEPGGEARYAYHEGDVAGSVLFEDLCLVMDDLIRYVWGGKA